MDTSSHNDTTSNGVKLWKNSYFVAICSLIILLVFFYVFKIGYTYTKTPDGQIVASYNWAYPLAIALVIWVLWQFWFFPQAEKKMTGGSAIKGSEPSLYHLVNQVSRRSGLMEIPFSHGVDPQLINMNPIH